MPLTSASTATLRIARRKGNCRVLGPGARAVVWFHGCSRGCPGCVAESMNKAAEFVETTPAALAAWVAACPGIEGVTLSGGEPLEQDPGALAEFLRLVRAAPRGLGVIMFTGYRLAELRGTPREAPLAGVDLLVDGPYLAAENDGRDLRGSRNQEFHFLTPRYRGMPRAFFGLQGRDVEIDLGLDNRIAVNGIPPPGFVERFVAAMRGRGYGLSFGQDEEDQR